MLSLTKSPRACETCSNRKIKCDRGLPSCIQCSKDGRTARRCHYRHRFLELSLRNETYKIAQVHGNNQKRLPSQCSSEFSGKNDPSESSSWTTLYQNEVIDRPFVGDLVLASGRNFLLTRFPNGVYHQYLPGIYLSSMNCPTLSLSIETIGLVCLSLGRNEKQLMLRAREKHVVALRTTSQLISNTMNDTTPHALVASIMLLALFAVMSPDNINAQEIWTKHVDGALTILATWMSAQKYPPTTTTAARNLVRHIANCVQLSYFQRHKKLPHLALQLYDCLDGVGRMQARLHTVINGMIDLHSKTQNTQIPCLQNARALDQELVTIMSILEESHPFNIIPGSARQKSKLICHEYSSHRAAQAWNFLRVLRLSLNNSFMTHVVKIERDYPDQMSSGVWHSLDVQNLKHRIFSTMASVAFDICASVPSFLRLGTFALVNDEDHTISRSDMVHWAHSLIWPLAMARDAKNIHTILNMFIDETLQILWQAARFPKTKMPEREHMEGVELKDWSHIFFWC